MCGVYVLYTNDTHMKLLRLYFLGLILSMEACFPIKIVILEDVATLYEEKLDNLISIFITTDFVHQSLLLLNA